MYTEGRRLIQERPHVLQSEAHYKESQTKEAHVFCVTLNYITSLCTSRKRRSRSSSQKEIRRELQSIPKTMHIPSGQGCSGQSSHFNAFVHWWVIYECTCPHHAEYLAVFDQKQHVPRAPPSLFTQSHPEWLFCFPNEKSPQREMFCWCGKGETKNSRSTKRHQNQSSKTVVSSGKKCPFPSFSHPPSLLPIFPSSLAITSRCQGFNTIFF